MVEKGITYKITNKGREQARKKGILLKTIFSPSAGVLKHIFFEGADKKGGWSVDDIAVELAVFRGGSTKLAMPHAKALVADLQRKGFIDKILPRRVKTSPTLNISPSRVRITPKRPRIS